MTKCSVCKANPHDSNGDNCVCKLPGEIYVEEELKRIKAEVEPQLSGIEEVDYPDMVDMDRIAIPISKVRILIQRAWEQGFGAARASKPAIEMNQTQSKEFPGLTEAQVESVKDEPSLLRAVRLFRDYTNFGLVEAVPLVRKIRGYKDSVREEQ